MLKIGLFLSLFIFFYSITVGQFPDTYKITTIVRRYLVPGTVAIIFLVGSTAIFKTPLAGIPWAILGWFLPNWIIESIEQRKKERFGAQAKDFITTAAGLFAAGQMTPEVIRAMAERSPEPMASEFANMIAIRNMNPSASFPRMFNDLAEKYKVEEFKAVASIIAAADETGGPRATARSLKQLGQALRQRDKLLSERKKALMEPKLAATIVIFLLSVGMVVDLTFAKHFFEGNTGKLVMALSSGILVGLIFMAKNSLRSDDL